jgi:type IV pilus assembly protein PilZ
MSENRRVHQRHECTLDVAVIHDGEELLAKTVNVSLGGMYLIAPRALKVGTEAKVRLRLPALKEDTELPVTVRWTTAEGFGVQFGSLRALEVWAFNQLFKGS